VSAPSRRCELNVTPLIDVLLVLLILFMVLVPQRERALASELSRGDASESGPPIRALVIDVAAGELLLDRVPMRDPAELTRGLRGRLSRLPDLPVLVRVAEKVPYSRVIDALDAADAAGARRIGLVGGAGAVVSSQ